MYLPVRLGQQFAGKWLTTSSLRKGEPRFRVSLPISGVEILPPQLISRYQCGITECTVRLELKCSGNKTAEKEVEATETDRQMDNVRLHELYGFHHSPQYIITQSPGLVRFPHLAMQRNCLRSKLRRHVSVDTSVENICSSLCA